MSVRKAVCFAGIAVLVAACAKMTEVQPNSEILPGYSTNAHDTRVSLDQQQTLDLLAVEWIENTTVALVLLDAQDDESLTRDSIACKFYSLETGEELQFSEERAQELKEDVWKAHRYDQEEVPEDEKKTDVLMEADDDVIGADYLYEGTIYSRNEDFTLDESQKLDWKGAAQEGGGTSIRDGTEIRYESLLDREYRWAVDLHPSGRYLRDRDRIYDLEMRTRYDLQNGFLKTYYAFSPTWDQLLILHTKGAGLSADIVDFQIENLMDATGEKFEERLSY